MIKQLIEALQIFAKYVGDEKYVAHSEHDTFYIGVPYDKVSEKDKKRLEELGTALGIKEKDKRGGKEMAG